MNQKPDDQEKPSFILDLWANIFYVFSRLSIFQIIRILFKSTRQSYRFVDWWVLGNLILALVAVIVFLRIPPVLQAILMFYSVMRIFEAIVYQVNVTLFEEYRAKKAGEAYRVKSFRRITILLMHNYVEIIFWYALLYLNFQDSFKNGVDQLQTALQATGFSF